MIEVVPIETTSLGDRSYIATDGSTALVVDPQRDIDRVLVLAEERDIKITHVFETHVHNDYVTGGLALAKLVDAEYVMSADDKVAFARRPIRDEDCVNVGSLRVRAMHTPGHTFTHMSFVLESGDDVVGIFSGGSLLFGATGRPDLLGEENAERLARHQSRSVGRIVRELPGHTRVFPTHGFGSFCAATQVTSDTHASTLADESSSNPALITPEEEFVRELLANLTPFPSYYAHMAGLNAAGPSAPDLSLPRPVDAPELLRRVQAGDIVVDLRNRRAFARRHLTGSLNFGLDGGLATHLGWVMPWGSDVTLIADTTEEIAAAQRELVRIGIDRPAAFSTTNAALCDASHTTSFPMRDFTALAEAARQGPLRVLDVRHDHERRESAIPGSLHIPLPELPARAGELPLSPEIWVHCAGGYRASIAAGLLNHAGYTVVAVDDDFTNAAEAGLLDNSFCAA